MENVLEKGNRVNLTESEEEQTNALTSAKLAEKQEVLIYLSTGNHLECNQTCVSGKIVSANDDRTPLSAESDVTLLPSVKDSWSPR